MHPLSMYDEYVRCRIRWHSLSRKIPRKEPKVSTSSDYDHTKPKYRLFLEGTVVGQYEPHPSGRFYTSLDEAEARAVHLIQSGQVSEPIIIFESVKVIAPRPVDLISYDVDVDRQAPKPPARRKSPTVRKKATRRR